MTGSGVPASWRIEKLGGRERRLIAKAVADARRTRVARPLEAAVDEAAAEQAFLAWSDATGDWAPGVMLWLGSPAQLAGETRGRSRHSELGLMPFEEWVAEWNPLERRGLLAVTRAAGTLFAPGVAPETILNSEQLYEGLERTLGRSAPEGWWGHRHVAPETEWRGLWAELPGGWPDDRPVTRARLRDLWMHSQPPRIQLQLDRVVEHTASRQGFRRGSGWDLLRIEVAERLMRATWSAQELERYLALPDDAAPPECGEVHRFGRVVVFVKGPLEQHLDAEGRLHREDGPAEAYRDGFRRWCWHGVDVDADFILHPEGVTAARVLEERNLEVQRVMLERFGWDRLLEESGAQALDEDPRFGALLLVPRADGGEALRIVRVTNATPEPDGTVRQYVLRVPPTMTTAREAVAWTFGMDAEEYEPRLES